MQCINFKSFCEIASTRKSLKRILVEESLLQSVSEVTRIERGMGEPVWAIRYNPTLPLSTARRGSTMVTE